MGSEGKTGRAQAVAGMISRVHIWRATTRSLSLCGAPRPWVSSFRKRARSPTADWVWEMVGDGTEMAAAAGAGKAAVVRARQALYGEFKASEAFALTFGRCCGRPGRWLYQHARDLPDTRVDGWHWRRRLLAHGQRQED